MSPTDAGPATPDRDGTPRPPRPTVAYREGWHEHLPAELKERSRWVVWRYEWDGTQWTKVFFCARHPDIHASATDPATWSDFATALACFEARRDDLDPKAEGGVK